MKHARFAVLFAAFFLFLPLSSVAQVQTGTPPFGTFGGGPDVINVANLNTHLTIPVVQKSGRGIPFIFNLTYDSSVWQSVNSGGITAWQPVTNWGWANSAFGVGYLMSSSTENSSSCTIGGRPGGKVETITTYWKYYDGLGTAHAYTDTSGSYYNSCTGQTIHYVFTQTAPDGSGYTLSIGASGFQSLIDSNGRNITPPVNSQNGAVIAEDTNGNEITSNSSGVYTDTLGTTALSISGSGTPSSPTKYAYTGPSGIEYYTVNFTSYTVATNFGVSGITEFGAKAESLVSSIVLPDGSQYGIQYEPTPSAPLSGACTPLAGTYLANCVTARIASVTFPTSGKISYAYSGGNNGILSDGSTATLTRTTPDTGSNNWTYAHAESGTAWTTAVTDPQGNQTAYHFQGIYQTERQVYSGSSTLLETVFTCYNTGTPNCNSTTVSSPILDQNIFVQWPSGLESETTFDYNGYGLLTGEVDFDYGNGGPGAELRKTIVDYDTNLGNIVNRPSEIVVENATGTGTSSGITYAYDQGSVTPTSNTPQHMSISGSRGNPTTVRYFVSGSTWLSKTFSYFDTGNVDVATDVNGEQTTYAYGDCGNSFQTNASITTPVNMATSAVWNCNGGVPTSTTDANNNPTNYAYDSMWRPTQIKFPDGGETDYSYNDATPSFTTTQKINASTNAVSTTIFDGLGRAKETQLTSDPVGTDYLDTTYDTLGRVASLSNPYRSTSDPTYGITQYSYDALNRVTTIKDADGSTATDSYSANCVTSTDEQGKNRQGCANSIGQLTQVTENPGGLGYVTSYTYDPLGNLLTVTQNGSRQRTFTYDGLSRLLTTANPESGTVTYTYDTATKGDLYTKKDARNITTTYTFDALHRLTQKSYSDGTLSAYFLYDQSTWNSNSLTNPLGRLTSFGTWNGSGWATESGLSYDPMGRVLSDWQCTPIKCPWSLAYQYDLAGDLISYTNGENVTFTQTFNAAAQLTQVTSSWIDSQHPGTLVTFNTYSPFGAVETMSYGNALTATTAFNNRLQPCRINSNSSGTALNRCTDAIPSGNLLDLNYSWNAGTSDNGDVMGWAAAGNQTFNRIFTYDGVNRLGSMSDSDSVASCQGLTWGYDAWGNRTAQTPTKGTCGSWSVSYSAQNQISGYTYDAAGNVLNDGVHSYTYDAENRITKVDGGSTASYVYDASGIRVEKTVGGSTLDDLYDQNGSIVTEANASGWQAGYIYAGSQLFAEYAADTTYFIHPDHLGSTRLMTEVNQSVYDSMDFLPFGEQASGGSGSSHKFTGYERDAESGLDYAVFRHYSSRQGRFMQSDPYNFGANITNPQSWNGYAYTLNNPLSYIDPTGLDCVYFDDSGDDIGEIDSDVSPSDCATSGGDWINGTVEGYSYDPNSGTFTFLSSDGNYNYTTTANAPGTQLDGSSCLGDCDLSYSQVVNSGFTFQIGVAVNWSFWGPLTGSGFAGIAIDSHGHIATYWGGGGGMSAGVGVSGGLQLAGSNGNSVCALGGPFTNVSGTAGFELAGTGDYFQGAGQGPGGVVRGGGLTIGGGAGVSGSAQITGTSVHPFGHSCVSGKIQ